MKKLKILFITVVLMQSMFNGTMLFAQTVYVPEPLKDWVDWVLPNSGEKGCPYLYDNDTRICTWPSRLKLDLNANGGQFTQEFELYGESLIDLPGDDTQWPLSVTSNGNDVLVESYNDQPVVRLPKGQHTLSGKFKWSKLPKSLYIPSSSGLVDLTVNSKLIERPVFNSEGQLWLLQSDNEKVTEDNLDMQVFRLIIDGHPVQVETLIKLRVSGKQRNANLGSVLLESFIATSINSDLPARLEGDDQFQVQLRPGEWEIKIRGRAPDDIQQFTIPELNEPWPEQEVWVFQSNNNMRQVQVTGGTSIDPNQTRLPNAWKGLPTFLLTMGESLVLDVKERGITNLERNELNLSREMWLDFDGNGYSIKDQLTGKIHQSRINVLPTIELGQVRINNQPQFITSETGEDVAGVEIRQKALNLSAESRYNGVSSLLPVNGWALDLHKVETNLHLPPGWQVLAVTGTDNLPRTWIKKWSLLDLFLVIIIIMSIRHFYGWGWAGLALFTMVFTWQEYGAPKVIWLNLLAITALIEVLRTHKYVHWLERYRWATITVLAVILLSYMFDTIRTSMYPQLDRGYTQQWKSIKQREIEQGYFDTDQAAATKNPNVLRRGDQDSFAAEEIAVVGTRKVMQSSIDQKRVTANIVDGLTANGVGGRESERYDYARKKTNLQQIDPNSMIQSGPGLPSWSGYRTIQLSWSGPVKTDQYSHIILIGPKTNFALKLLGILFLLGLTYCFIQASVKGNDDEGGNQGKSKASLWGRFKSLRSSTAVVLMLCVLFSMSIPEKTFAQGFPDVDILDDLEERLTALPECLGDLDGCALIEQMSVNATVDQLQLRLRVHATIKTAIPLPASQRTWLPTQILLNGRQANAISRDSDQVLWISLDRGHHDIVLSGPMLQRVSFPLSLPLSPKYASWGSSDNTWSVEGIDDDGLSNAQLQFTRVVNEDSEDTFQTDHSTLPTFVKVERQLRLGLDWYVQTTVSRFSPQNVPLNISIPLLDNEQLLGEQLNVENGQVALSFAANQSQLSWSSRLTVKPKITLTAATHQDYLEIWNVDASPIWRVKAQGLPVNRFLKSNEVTARGNEVREIPVWQPWPDESLVLDIDRPEGVAGQTITIQNSLLSVTAGKRINDVALYLSVRSSRGLQHQIRLPDNAEVQELDIDNVKQRVQIEDNLLSLSLKPGKQDVIVKWREPNSQALVYEFPIVDLRLPSVNAHSLIQLSKDRWVLWVQGPILGPAVLFWSVLFVLLALSIALGWSRQTPLKSWQWFLLAIGLSQTSPALMVVVVACLIGLSFRKRLTNSLTTVQFNLMQLSLIGMSLVSMCIMVAAVANGLLGSPDMQIAGNGSYSSLLKWYQDRVSDTLPQPEIISVPIWVYRVLMLLWAMWLARSLLNWIKWGWEALSDGQFWRKDPKLIVETEVDVVDQAEDSPS